MDIKRLKEEIQISLLRSLRHEKGFSQRKLAEKARISRGRLHRLEAGSFETATYDELLRIAQALEMNVEELFRIPGASKIPSNGASRDRLHYEGKQGNFRIVSLITPRPELFVGKLILNACEDIASSELPAARTFFLQALMGNVRLRVDGKQIHIPEGDHFTFSGTAPFIIQNPTIREHVSLLITSPALNF